MVLTTSGIERYFPDMQLLVPLLIVFAGADAPNQEPSQSKTYPPEVMKQFVTKVQPILANACATCHSTSGCGSFSLHRVTPGSAIPVAITKFNLAAAAGQIDKNNPDRSKLLTKSITAHGGLRQPPIKDNQAAAYKSMEQWVKLMTNDAKATKDTDSQQSDKPIDPFDPAIFNNKKDH
jgi:hypothetical protein